MQEAVATSIVRFADEQRTISSSNADSQSGSCEIAQDCTWPDALIDINEASPGDTASHTVVGCDMPAAIKSSESMAEDDFSGVKFHEAFWAVPEWRLPKSDTAPPEQKAIPHPSIAYLQGPHSLNSLAAESAARKADSAGNDDNASDRDIPQHKASSMDGVDQQSVTASQVRALQDLVLSMQQLLGHAAKKRAAMQQQLQDAKASAEQLQILQQVNETELAMWRAGAHVGSMTSQEQGLEHVLSSELQQTQVVLHQALAHQEEFMAQVMNLPPVLEAPIANNDDDDDAPVAPRTVVKDTQAEGNGSERDTHKPDAAATPLVTEQPEASKEEDEQASPDSPLLTADGKDNSAAEPQQQLMHAHAVIAVLAGRLGELECCNALLQDQLARSTDDLIKSGPQEPWHADGFPWDDRAPGDDGEQQASRLVSAATLDSRDGAFQPDEPAAAAAEQHDYLSELREHEAIAAAAQAGHLQTPGQTAESLPEADSKHTAVDTDARAAADTESHRPVEALPMPHALASSGKEANADSAELSDVAQRVQAHSAADDAQMASRLAAALVAARLVETLPSQHVLASPDKDASSEEDNLSNKPPTDRAHSDTKDAQLASRLAAAEEQNARLAATHAELERWLLHAQHQLTDYAAAHTDELLSPARKLFHGASFALTKAVAEVKSTSGLATPELQPLMVSEPARVSASSQACTGHDGNVQSSADKAGTMAELAASRTKLARVAAELADSERCRESLQQQLLGMGEAKMQTLAAANLPEQATAVDSSMLGEATDAEAQEWQPADTQLFSEDAQAPRCPACRRSQGEMINEAGRGTLEASISEVAALQVAMAQSEAIFLDLEAQLRAGFEREQASRGRIAALEQQLQTAVVQGRIAAPRGQAQQETAAPKHAALDAPGLAPASPERQVGSSQDACEQAAGAAAECQSGQEGSTQPLQQQVQAITAQLRAAQNRASDAEGIIGRLQDQVFDQLALVAELQSSLTAAQAKSPPADQAAQQMDEGALRSKAMSAQQLLTTPHQPAASLTVVKLIKKGPPLGPVRVDMSPLLVACTLIAGQSESPEELYDIISRESSTFAPQQKGAHRTGLPAPPAATAGTKGNGMERTASPQSASNNMRENPLFLRGVQSGIPDTSKKSAEALKGCSCSGEGLFHSPKVPYFPCRKPGRL